MFALFEVFTFFLVVSSLFTSGAFGVRRTRRFARTGCGGRGVLPGRGAEDEAFCQDGVRRTRRFARTGCGGRGCCQDGVRRTRLLPGRGEEDEAVARTG
jgi:hypothetical protein